MKSRMNHHILKTVHIKPEEACIKGKRTWPSSPHLRESFGKREMLPQKNSVKQIFFPEKNISCKVSDNIEKKRGNRSHEYNISA